LKVLLLVPKVTRLFEEAPLGIMYIAAVIRNAGHSVELLDGNAGFLRSELARRFVHGDVPDLIGMACTTLTFPLVMELADFIGKIHPDVKIIIGGSHATIMPETLLANPNIDYCVIGEGEETIRRFAYSLRSSIEDDSDMDKPWIKGIAYLGEDKDVHFNDKQEPIQDLDSIPFPARDLLDPIYFKNGRTTLIASRGCPYNCNYCQPTLRKMFGNKVRRRSVQNVVDEMLEMYEKFGIRFFKFVDDTFTADRNWTIAFCKKVFETFNDSGKHVNLECLTRVNDVELEMLKAMKKAGFYVLDFGVECGSQRILDYYRKGITVAQSIEAVKMCKKAGIKAHTCLMIGAPIETMEDINETRKLIKKMSPDSLCVAITTPMPHTAMWDALVKDGVLSEQDWLKVGDYLQKWGGVCQNVSEKELFKLKQEIQRNFWLRKAMKNPKLLYDYMRYHDSGSFIRAARYFLWKGDYS